MYLQQDSALASRPVSVVSISCVRQESELIHAAALVSQPAVSAKERTSLRSLWVEMVPPSEAGSEACINCWNWTSNSSADCRNKWSSLLHS
ncbi:hypothetical protein ACFX2F_026983 [Malus domestica]